MSDIKPIQTQYKGYRFRSRLEARWAVFFDALGVAWEYEKEGFEMHTGERYLPDFWLPKDQMWVEVKGEEPPSDYTQMLERFQDLAGSALLVVRGLPAEKDCRLFAYDDTSGSAGAYDMWVTLSSATKGRLQFTSSNDPRLVDDRTIYAKATFDHPLDVSYLPIRTIFPSVAEAADKAKSARFEFGETPQ